VLPFILTNSGNVEDTFHLQAISANGWQVSLPSASVALPPGESRTIECALKIPSWAPPGLAEEVTLTATSAATGYQAQAKARIKIGQPIGEGRISVGEEEFRLTCDLGFSFVSPPSSVEPPQLWLHAVGSGKPNERLEVLLAGEEKNDRFALTDYFVLYRENGYEVKAGDFPSTWPGLVFPGTSRMGLEASYELRPGRLQIMGGLDNEGGNLSWYALGWSGYRRGWSGSFRLLSAQTGINGSDVPYLDLSVDRYLLGASFSGDLAVELKEGARSAGYLQYSTPAAPFGWEGGFSWSNGINRANSIQTFSLGGTYNPASGLKAGLSLSQTEATATSTESAYLARQADLRLRLGARTTAALTAKGIWKEDFAWDLSQTYYLLKLSYQNRLPGS
ncbi:MAG: hypothetical protein K6U03_12375, partial [Firmicutes bacterium]|nr:hypothetical protein [Bacillota bacterium]